MTMVHDNKNGTEGTGALGARRDSRSAGSISGRTACGAVSLDPSVEIFAGLRIMCGVCRNWPEAACGNMPLKLSVEPRNV
eukprot:2270380-Pyramimonas_sp.AAC.1